MNQLKKGRNHPQGSQETAPSHRIVTIAPHGLEGELVVPLDPRGIVLFAHGSGSSHLSPRNRAVAATFNAHGLATLLFDLLTPAEAVDRRNVFDIPLLADRVTEAVRHVVGESEVNKLPMGLFGSSTGAAAALVAAAKLGTQVSAVVSRGGRPDLAEGQLDRVTAPTLLIVGGADSEVIALNRHALGELYCDKLLRIVPGAGHLFEEPGTLEAMTRIACEWFEHYLGQSR
ncbi:dienelactone hydrolase family protein [Aliiruegeria lutimaris]|nr:alpha/beta family hydrolase [Aliiruegeria lutimaris]